MDETPFYYGYIRYSRKEQREGDSLPRQLAHHESRSSELRARWIDEYRDEGVSSYRGRNLTHGELGRFFDDVRAGKVKPGAILGVENQDRLGRLPAHLILPVIFDALTLGVVLDIRGRSLTQQLVNDQPHLLYEVLGEAIRSNEESKRKGDFPRKRNARKRKEAHLGKRKFDGKRHVPWVMPNPDGTEEYVEHPERADTLREIFRLVDTYGYGGTRIARRFNDPNNSVESFGPSNTWHPGYISGLLRNRAVLGEWQPMICDQNGRKVPDPDGVVHGWYPRVVDEDVFDRVQLVLDKNNTNPGGDRGGNRGGGRMGPHFSNLFFQIGKCAECGKSLILNWHTRRDGSRVCYLRCSWSRKKKCTNRTGYSYALFERQFLYLERFMIAHTNAGLPAPTTNAGHNLLASLTGDLDTKEASMLRMMHRFADETDPARQEAAENVMNVISKEIAALKEKLIKERREARASELDDDPFYNKRMNALQAKLNSSDPKERTDTRAAINKELKRRVDRIWLRPDRSMVIRINDGRRNLTCWESVIDPKTIRSVQVLDRHDDSKVMLNVKTFPQPFWHAG